MSARPYHAGYLLYLIPVIGFTFSDTVAFMSLSRLNPATFSLIWNCKTAFVAVLYRCFIKRRPIQWHKWLGVALLLLGPGVAEFGNLWRGLIPVPFSAQPDCQLIVYQCTRTHLGAPVHCERTVRGGVGRPCPAAREAAGARALAPRRRGDGQLHGEAVQADSIKIRVESGYGFSA